MLKMNLCACYHTRRTIRDQKNRLTGGEKAQIVLLIDCQRERPRHYTMFVSSCFEGNKPGCFCSIVEVKSMSMEEKYMYATCFRPFLK